jgi:hypothetical protein
MSNADVAEAGGSLAMLEVFRERAECEGIQNHGPLSTHPKKRLLALAICRCGDRMDNSTLQLPNEGVGYL